MSGNHERFFPQIGMRNVKTAVSVLICLFLSALLRRHSAFYACIAAVMCIQPSYDKTLRYGLNRFIGTVIGGTVGYFVLELSLLLPSTWWCFKFFLYAVCIILLIYICGLIRRAGSSAICCIVFLSIVTNVDRGIQDTLLYVVNRVIDTTIGIAVAMAVDRLLFVPDWLRLRLQRFLPQRKE